MACMAAAVTIITLSMLPAGFLGRERCRQPRRMATQRLDPHVPDTSIVAGGSEHAGAIVNLCSNQVSKCTFTGKAFL